MSRYKIVVDARWSDPPTPVQFAIMDSQLASPAPPIATLDYMQVAAAVTEFDRLYYNWFHDIKNSPNYSEPSNAIDQGSVSESP